MIEDFDDGLRGLLLDWEFAVKITKQGEYDLGGTVSVRCRDSPVSRCRIGSTDTGLLLP